MEGLDCFGATDIGAVTTIPKAGADYTDAKTVAAVQQALVKRGYDLGKSGPNGDGVDGDFGPKTKAAIQKLQKSLGTEPHGRIDEGVIVALQVTPGVLPPGVTMAGRAAVQAEVARQAATAAARASSGNDQAGTVKAAQDVFDAAPAQPPELKEEARKTLEQAKAATTPAAVQAAAAKVQTVANQVQQTVLPWWKDRAWSGGPPRWQAGLAITGGVVGAGALIALLAAGR